MLRGIGDDEGDRLAFGRKLRAPGMGVFAPRVSIDGAELADRIETAVPGRRIAVGCRDGADVAAAILVRRPAVFSAAVLLSPMVPFVPETLPNLMGIRVHLDCGEDDPIVPKEDAARLAAMLSRAGARVSVRWHSGGHGPDAEGVREAKRVVESLR